MFMDGTAGFTALRVGPGLLTIVLTAISVSSGVYVSSATAEETGARVTVQPKLLVAVITALETGTWVGSVP